MPASHRPVCVLLSGGIDSAVLLQRFLALGHRVLPVYARCGLFWEATELWWVRRLLQKMRCATLFPLYVMRLPLRSIYGSHWSLTGRRIPSATSQDAAVYLPGRNILLLGQAAIVAVQRNIHTLAIGTLNSNPFGDASPRFFNDFSQCLSQALHEPVRILAPLQQMTKAQLIHTATDVPLELTFSCLHPQRYVHCGRCNKCAERQRAFRAAHVPDPTRYA